MNTYFKKWSFLTATLFTKVKKKDFFNENEYDSFYPFGSAPTPIYGKCTNFALVIHFLNFIWLFCLLAILIITLHSIFAVLIHP